MIRDFGLRIFLKYSYANPTTSESLFIVQKVFNQL